MAEQAKASVKKTGTTKAATPTKAATKKRVSKGESMACEVCGLSVVVEEVGGIAVAEESVLLCCGKPMKAKAVKAKVSSK
jgi:hypothetical protein